jgi:hypothetical protein
MSSVGGCSRSSCVVSDGAGVSILEVEKAEGGGIVDPSDEPYTKMAD